MLTIVGLGVTKVRQEDLVDGTRGGSGTGIKFVVGEPLSPNTMYILLQSYLARLPGALKETERPDGTKKLVCIYTPHSLRATVATLLLDSGVDISSVRDLLGHRHVTTTQIYDKRRRGTADSASHQVPL